MRGLPATNSWLLPVKRMPCWDAPRINGKLRCAPPPRPEQPGPGRPKKHGDILHPGWDIPEIPPDEELVAMHSQGELRLRRWQYLHFEDFADTILDVVRIDHPDYEKPLLLGTIARELTTEQIWSGYKHRFDRRNQLLCRPLLCGDGNAQSLD